ncbi:molybdopterin-guanine dinucleotide biosynthesis protein B [Metasolibacillus sp.]|uniref:molybdopterin-guanine dinucleotide biosynthesis protein B n=1 Tax=Metasolibacillus sp. TaxID=2703680 RepID=UPI0025E676BA|nr:molybdopterin-guanine dinucleotide biosynthesis protein B [Metasolibacillus sp.]MCT6924166.1 molybdopterin-guanine dinucleotide biosynthesis protein B [Metasolibacillus sp.]MCT6940273.1 molybdopterin-guanine dinucleotide biosynthesis protein B [Metasolibacillus sp.]
MALGQHRKILQIVGYQNSGKTTLMEQLISSATKQGLRVATIKHHGHGGAPQVDKTKDSARHEAAGATITAVEGEGTLRLSIQQQCWELADIVAIYDAFPIDCLLIEGYKKAHYPKVVLLRTEADEVLLQQLSNIVCVIYWHKQLSVDYPIFSINETAQYIDFLMTEMRKD